MRQQWGRNNKEMRPKSSLNWNLADLSFLNFLTNHFDFFFFFFGGGDHCLMPGLKTVDLRHPAPVSYTRVYDTDTVKPVCNDHLYNKIHYLWFIQ